MYVLNLLMYVLHVSAVDARTYIEEKKLTVAVSTYLLLYVRTFCTYLVLVYLLIYVRSCCTHCCSYWCMYVPIVRAALTNAISTYLLAQNCGTYCTYLLPYVQLMTYVFTYCCTHFRDLLQVPTDNVTT